VWYYRSGDANGLTTEHTDTKHPHEPDDGYPQ
jgi:hypothetical protein